ncbi:DUF3341 domain-containing protein [Planctomicrobium sp. SH664]|uniref:DUF3341 domain-containing protein n=1 Tax=Planctomicrobium sp. SH664 TaxID=3448125 RepID=UPI003F5B380D
MTAAKESPKTYGLLAEFNDSESLIHAARTVTEKGYVKVEAYTSFPIEELSNALNFRRSGLPLVVLIGGILGCAGGYFMQYWLSVHEYPLNIGGRPNHSWPAFIPVTFELTILVAALSAVLGMLALNGLPRPHHPLFAIPQFERASTDGYFLGIQAIDPLYDEEATAALLRDLQAKEVIHVPMSE